MPSGEKHKINCWIQESLWKQVETLGYDSPTKATIAAFEALILKASQASTQESLGSPQETPESTQDALRKLQEAKLPELEKQLEEARRQIKAYEEKLRTAPDPVELAQLRARSEELERQIDILKNDIEKAERDKEDLKTTYNNYFLQVQTLINQKAIEAPGAKKPWWQFW